MKFKIASVLELIIPLSVALMLSAFLGCGGGSYGDGTQAYDGVWNAAMKIGDPAGIDGGSAVSCAEPNYVSLTIEHGFGHTTASTSCLYGTANPTGWADYTTNLDVKITYASQAAGATIAVDAYVGALLIGTCDTPNSCRAEGFYMYR